MKYSISVFQFNIQAKKNLNRYNDTRWLSRAKACDDIVKLFNLMKQFESTMNKLINIRNEENTIKIPEYRCPVTNEDYQICVTLNQTLKKLKTLIIKFEERTHNGYFNALKHIVKYTQFIKDDLTANGLENLYNIFIDYLISKIKKYEKFSELLSIGAILNPNLDIEDLIDDKSPFYFLIAKGKELITNHLKNAQKTNQDLTHTSHKKGRRTKKANKNEFDAWSSIAEPIEHKEEEMIYKYWQEQTNFPLLQEIALSVCSYPTSSSDCERLFSLAKYVLGVNRCNMSNENIKMSVMLFANYEIAKDAIMKNYI